MSPRVKQRGTVIHSEALGIGCTVRSLDVAFPLTLALSLGEREQENPHTGQPRVLDVSKRGGLFSLSPREGAGVRGKGVWSNLRPAP